MKIRYIKFQNILSNESEIEINFMNKLPKDEYESKRFFAESIRDKKRSKISREGISKKMAIMGTNATYKSSTLLSIKYILDFIQNFKINVLYYKFEAFFSQEKNIEDFFQWKEIQQIEKKSSSLNSFWEQYFKEVLNKNKTQSQIIEEFLDVFYQEKAFNKDNKIIMKVIFFDEQENKDLVFEIEISKEEITNKTTIKSFLNDEKVDLFNYENTKLQNFKSDFASFEYYNKEGYSQAKKSTKQHQVINDYLDSSLNFLFFERFGEDIEKLLNFIQNIDNSIVNIKYKANTETKTMISISFDRVYKDHKEGIAPEQLSTGTKVFIVYTYFILKNDFIIIDELEQSLHLSLVELLLEIASENQTQVLFSTHSPAVIEKNIKNYELYITHLSSDNELDLVKGVDLLGSRDSFISRYLKGLVSDFPKSKLDNMMDVLFDE